MQNDDFNIDVVLAEITAFAENMHCLLYTSPSPRD